PDYISGLTLLGGDPFEPENQEGLINFVRTVRQTYPEKTIWAFTGYLLDADLAEGGKKYTEYTEELLGYIDVLVDGPFIEEEKNLMLSFRGSENQRIILMDETRRTGKVVLSPLMEEGTVQK
ncbi:MAG: radical SAM protein, partial [Clostridiales bacterium]|nr:radical SAM protein [Clostridiales bacterium]